MDEMELEQPQSRTQPCDSCDEGWASGSRQGGANVCGVCGGAKAGAKVCASDFCQGLCDECRVDAAGGWATSVRRLWCVCARVAGGWATSVRRLWCVGAGGWATSVRRRGKVMANEA
ncbi:hypothetical protein BVRB_3g057200 [Beta vulgaris subsp. vulgaris]|nr:hypothetical protein BVRB_3g057200 [Beta vulgaris subsp. vulgaris]